MSLWVEKHISLQKNCQACAGHLLRDIKGILGQAWYVLSPRSTTPIPSQALLHAGLHCGYHHLCCLPLVSWQEAVQAELIFGHSAWGLKKEGGCGAAKDAPWWFREPLHNTFLMSAPPEGCWNVSEPSGEKWSVARSSWTLTAAI